MLYNIFKHEQSNILNKNIKKNEKENISREDKYVISKIINEIERNLKLKKPRGEGNEKSKSKK